MVWIILPQDLLTSLALVWLARFPLPSVVSFVEQFYNLIRELWLPLRGMLSATAAPYSYAILVVDLLNI